MRDQGDPSIFQRRLLIVDSIDKSFVLARAFDYEFNYLPIHSIVIIISCYGIVTLAQH